GFCTPGFVMSLFATYSRHLDAESRPDRRHIADDLAGNLCRCTGYRPILDAAERMFALPPVRLDTAPIIARLRNIAAETAEPFLYAARNPAYPAQDGGRVDRFFAPRSASSLGALYEEMPGARLLAGATDIGLWVNKQFRDVGDLISVTEVAELNAIAADEERLRIGAAVPLQDAWAALVRIVPACAEMALRFAGPPIRHAGTMGGNIANGSPIGDSAPVLMALDAVLVLQRGQQTCRLRLDEFYHGYMRNAMSTGEFLRGIEISLPGPDVHVRAYKISKRADSDISALSCGASIRLDGGMAAEIRLAFGGMAAVVKRAAHAEAALRGACWNEAAIRRAMDALEHDFTPLSDFRASSGYRLRVARNLLWRFWLETRPADPLPARETRARAPAFAEAAP
ncbi:MAG TPA: FAD binding domain-containing protein, partial [Acetobacteraceae bacterium]|nr:FAD binding domain-containing protein [Acetobacteraceae bacterium]